MDQILRCDWLPERARWNYLARSGLPAVSRKKNFPESLVPFLRVYGPRLRLGPQTRKKRTWPISSHLHLTLGQ